MGRSLQRNGTGSEDHRFCGPRLFWHSIKISRNLVYPTMLQKAKRVTGFLAEMSETSDPLNAVAYTVLKGGWSPKKRGVPKNAGISDDMYENKGQKNSCRGYPTMFMKTGDLTVISDDIDENKPLNTRSALAQRAMLSGFIVCSPRREFTSRNGGLKLPLRGRHYGRPAGAERGSATHPCRLPISQSFTVMRQPARIGEPRTGNRQLIRTPPPARANGAWRLEAAA